MSAPRDYLKGNEAIAYGALHAGVNAYFAYPITPSSEVPETFAREFGRRDDALPSWTWRRAFGGGAGLLR